MEGGGRKNMTNHITISKKFFKMNTAAAAAVAVAVAAHSREPKSSLTTSVA